ncbi:hypothetical protein AURDEDRAFT_114312 [Auricularia subglabra TFB-10046 SS5]|uniref:Thioredoxin domain-containing protein n=1 Tax=Auricularia subglabra (strain TFB-10046 / SS5) TaxID=717982 RepID=J0LKW3_AURST|nr:hypothetical protein AURDEDRAFT_114312 [Auricularia subglabra TFB-10046 SS5]
MTSAQPVLTAEELSKACELPVLDQDGKSVQFGTLFADQRTILVFIRHFWCGSCQDYVAQLATVPLDAFSKAGVKLVVIGCGEPSMIRGYKELTAFPHDMYADPTRKLYDLVGAEVNLDMPAERPSYIRNGYLLNVLRSIWRGPIANPTTVGKQGPAAQNGGDFVVGPGNTCSFAWRMRNTQDHVEVKDLMKHAGVEYGV